MSTKFAIGCLVQWYEIEMLPEYIDTLLAAVNTYDRDKVLIDLKLVTNQELEQLDKPERLTYILSRFDQQVERLEGYHADVFIDKSLVTIADYRREFNSRYCDLADVLMWGESDSLLPEQTFVILDNLHQVSLQNNNTKYLAFFGTCKMWDDSWKPIEHTDFTDKPVDNKAWWGTRYVTSIEEMNKINDKVTDLDVRIVSPHKFNGCGLVISSEVIRAGVNIPKSVFFIHEDTALMMMTNRVLGNIPQYIIKNILLVHNREHSKKRMYVANETGETLGERRKSNEWYKLAGKMSEQNCHNLFNPQYKSYTWKDVWQAL